MRSIYRFVVALLVVVTAGYVVLGAGWRPGAIPRPAPALSVPIQPAYPTASLYTTAALPNTFEPSFSVPITGAIVNHHLLAASFIDDTLRQAWRPDIHRIILLAPNHFSAGYGAIISTTRSFATPFGEVPVDADAVRRLAGQGIVSLDDEPFKLEHGVYNILPYLRRHYPNVPIVPMLTKVNASIGMVDAVREQLGPEVSRTTLVITSLDFAHGQTARGAAALDAESLRVLNTLDLDTARLNHDGLIGVDSPMSLRLFLGLMRQRGAERSAILHHSNSAVETGQLMATDVTSHITALFSRFPLVVQ